MRKYRNTTLRAMVLALHARNKVVVWWAHPLEKWQREELIAEILDLEYPNVCRLHDSMKPCASCGK